jgi:hypothetical protein
MSLCNINIVSFAGSIFGIGSALVGLVGILLEKRTWLSLYTIVLWPGFALYVAVGYIAFRRAKQHLRAHIREEWLYEYTREQRLLVQRNVPFFLALCLIDGGVFFRAPKYASRLQNCETC